jgi:hypothetical protein
LDGIGPRRVGGHGTGTRVDNPYGAMTSFHSAKANIGKHQGSKMSEPLSNSERQVRVWVHTLFLFTQAEYFHGAKRSPDNDSLIVWLK